METPPHRRGTSFLTGHATGTEGAVNASVTVKKQTHPCTGGHIVKYRYIPRIGGEGDHLSVKALYTQRHPHDMGNIGCRSSRPDRSQCDEAEAITAPVADATGKRPHQRIPIFDPQHSFICAYG